jgi:hypothetical protein
MSKTHSIFANEDRGHAMACQGRQRRMLVALLLGLVGHSAIAGTAGVFNGEFDADLNGWTLAGPPFAGWSMFDYQGNALSGSADLFNDAGQGGVRLYPLRQCVNLPASGSYRLEAQGYLPAGHPAGRLVISLSGHAAADCSGGSNLGAGFFLNSNGNWQYGSIVFTIEPGFNYVEVSLGIEKDAAGGNLLGNIDAVRFVYRELIFANGFEAGDLPLPEP